jgi:Lipocalin-like domain
MELPMPSAAKSPILNKSAIRNPLFAILATALLLAVPARANADTIDGRWKLIAAEDLRADGRVARYPWGQHPVGSIVVERGSCYVQIMSSDVPSFAASTSPVADQMKAALLSTYIAYSGPCTVDSDEGSVTLKVEAAWRPDYVGTTQKRFFRFDNGALVFGPAPGSIRGGTDALTRRLTLERAR